MLAAEVVQVGLYMSTFWECLETWEHERERQSLQAHIVQLSAKLRHMKLHVFHRAPVFEKWLVQYPQDAFSYRDLVLEGPSAMGKTSSA